jgi:hypothetical protein
VAENGRRLSKGEMSKAFAGWAFFFFVYGFFIDFASSQFSAIFHGILRLRHWFLVFFAQVGKWGEI